MSNIFNYDDLLSNYLDEKDIVNEILGVYINKVKEQLILLNDYINNCDYPQIQFVSHSIKGSSYNITAEIVGDISLVIEKASKEMNIEIIKNKYGLLTNEFKLLTDEINKVL